jgi:hypothetical protein
MDHHEGLMNAAKTQLHIGIYFNFKFVMHDHDTDHAILCWPHIKRNALIQNRHKIFSSNYFEKAQDDISQLHLARSQRQFVSLASLMLHQWRADRENELADWFEATYLIEPFNRWSVTSSGIPGVSPNQNPIESFHREQKREQFGQEGKNNVLSNIFKN